MAEDRPNFLLAGFLGRCPNCGRGPLFAGFLRVNERCPACGEALSVHASDDGPAYFVMSLVGTIVVGGLLVTEIAFHWSITRHFLIWLPLTVVLSLGLLRPVKGMLTATQFKTRAREGKAG